MRILGLQRQQEKSVQLLFCLAALLFFKKLSFWSVEIQASVQKTRGQRWKRVLSFKIKFGRIRTFSHLIFSTYLKTFMIWFHLKKKSEKRSILEQSQQVKQHLNTNNFCRYEIKQVDLDTVMKVKKNIYIYVNLANPQPFKQHYLLQTMAIAEY